MADGIYPGQMIQFSTASTYRVIGYVENGDEITMKLERYVWDV